MSTCWISSLPHDDHPVAHRHRLDLVVGHVDRRRADLALDAGDLGAHLHAQLRVEVRQRLVHEQDSRVPHDRAAHRDPLPLAARQAARSRSSSSVRRSTPAISWTRRRLRPSAPCASASRSRCCRRRHVRIERVVLKDHRDVALAAACTLFDDRVADQDRPLGDILETRDHPERRRLPAPRWAYEHHELAVADFEVSPSTARVPSGKTFPTRSKVTDANGYPTALRRRKWSTIARLLTIRRKPE